MEITETVQYGNRMVKSVFVNSGKTNMPDFLLSEEYKKLGLLKQANLVKIQIKNEHVNNLGFRKLRTSTIREIGEHYLYIATGIHPSRWNSQYDEKSGICGFYTKWCACDVWIELTNMQSEIIPIRIAQSLVEIKEQNLFDAIFIASTANVKDSIILRYFSPVAIGVIYGYNRYKYSNFDSWLEEATFWLLARWGDYPQFLDYPDFKIPQEQQGKADKK